MPRSADPEADRANGEALLASSKDQEEHAVVVEYVVEALRPFCRKLDVPTAPELVSTPAIWHLRTAITGELVDRDVTALDLAAALHPTPAICGTPTAAARDLVQELEPFDRGYYAGTVGWVDASGDGEWAVAVRCAEITSSTMRLYAGGGIVPASDAQAEFDETVAKLRTLLGAMGLD
jgi:isochorismate synthase